MHAAYACTCITRIRASRKYTSYAVAVHNVTFLFYNLHFPLSTRCYLPWKMYYSRGTHVSLLSLFFLFSCIKMSRVLWKIDIPRLDDIANSGQICPGIRKNPCAIPEPLWRIDILQGIEVVRRIKLQRIISNSI